MLNTVYLKDYTHPPFKVVRVELSVDLHVSATVIDSTLYVEKNIGDGPLELDGEGLDLLSIKLDGRALEANDWSYSNDKLVVHAPPQKRFMLEIQQRCNPQSNTVLSGLYISSGTYCTQMEAEGFRRFAFMQDRPDVMATYLVHIYADKNFPVLLSNGNKVSSGSVAGSDKHFTIWEDPHPKPTYLFALVAGNLASVKDSFTTIEGRKVELGIYVEQGKQDRCDWAMTCLKASMKWDEERFGRAYDLDVFNIVAVSDFNMGAMENKGLNIFNDKYILARPDTATDSDYVNIERIIAHEYFHNWSGNRITCRDWFQLCLKEGLTVFRDQEFTSDLRSRAVKRIEDVKTLRARQFPEDQGPLAHAVRPEGYIEINNFYTPTIYEKGAEICRMLHTLLGAETFRKAMDSYFARHDGEAATVEDFLNCMSEASQRDLTHFAKWYEQAGTPVLEVKTYFDAEAAEFTVTLSQHTPETPGQTNKVPLHLPIALALLDGRGEELPLKLEENARLSDGLFEFTSAEATLTFQGVPERPVLSINRGFSAPIILRGDATEADLLFQMARDKDSFNRWEAAQTCALRLLVDTYHGATPDSTNFAEGLRLSLQNPALDDAFKALMLQLPNEAELTVAIAQNVDAQRVHDARMSVLQQLGQHLEKDLQRVLASLSDNKTYSPDTASCAHRSLRGAALTQLYHAKPEAALEIAGRDFAAASNMTSEVGALGGVLASESAEVDAMLQGFYDRHQDDHLLVDKWFMLKAARASSAKDIEMMKQHNAFTFKTPNRVYALLGGFTGGNLRAFHAADGAGYRLLGESIVKLNAINPQVAARMANSFRSWGRYDSVRKSHAAAVMQDILRHDGLSNDVFEIISRTLNG
jgi:aminopeptidase N